VTYLRCGGISPFFRRSPGIKDEVFFSQRWQGPVRGWKRSHPCGAVGVVASPSTSVLHPDESRGLLSDVVGLCAISASLPSSVCWRRRAAFPFSFATSKPLQPKRSRVDLSLFPSPPLFPLGRQSVDVAQFPSPSSYGVCPAAPWTPHPSALLAEGRRRSDRRSFFGRFPRRSATTRWLFSFFPFFFLFSVLSSSSSLVLFFFPPFFLFFFSFFSYFSSSFVFLFFFFFSSLSLCFSFSFFFFVSFLFFFFPFFFSFRFFFFFFFLSLFSLCFFSSSFFFLFLSFFFLFFLFSFFWEDRIPSSKLEAKLCNPLLPSLSPRGKRGQTFILEPLPPVSLVMNKPCPRLRPQTLPATTSFLLPPRWRQKKTVESFSVA